MSGQKTRTGTFPFLHIKERGGGTRLIDPMSISYVESNLRILHIHTAQGVVDTYMRLSEFKTLVPHIFVQCHKSFLVNLDAVLAYKRNQLELADGSVIPMSRSQYKAVYNALHAQGDTT